MLENTANLFLGGNPNGKSKAKDKEVAKFNRVAKIQKLYPEIDSKLRHYCSVKSMSERKACAYAVLMMIETGIRIGNEDSAEGYISKAKKTEGQTLQTYGLTTLKREHVSFPADGTMTLDFVGKKSVDQFIVVSDPFLVSVGKEFYAQNGFERWLCLPNGEEITKMMVHKFIKKSIRGDLSPKDFRTFRANVEAARLCDEALKAALADVKKKQVNDEIKSIVNKVAEVLGNTGGIAKKAYINPEILRKYWEQRGFDVEVVTQKGKKKEIITKVKQERV